ncbi:MAG: fatty acid desaturase [Elusimicrobia bacterium]|nr:fatty acid desaturase [Elusimicrobiota bacterium]
MNPGQREFNWVNIAFLTLSPIAAIIGAVLYIYHQGFHWVDLVLFVFMAMSTGVAITAGYHRYFAHRTYECRPGIQFLYHLFGAAALQNSVLYWASDHRYHHRYVDTEDDPYNIMKGIFWAHMGWIFYKTRPDRNFDSIPDLKEDRLVIWQNRYYLPIAITVSFVLPTLIGWAVGRPFGGFLWGGLLRVVLVHHGTFLINSAAHFIGAQPYSNKDTSRDNWWLAPFTFGEGYHNFHHAFQGDYRNGHAWYHWDPCKWWVWTISHVGLTWRLNRTPEWAILQAKMDMGYLKARSKIEQLPDDWRRRLTANMNAIRERFEAAKTQMIQSKNRYGEQFREARANALREGRQLQARWDQGVQEARISLKKAWQEHKRLVKEIRRLPLPTAI